VARRINEVPDYPNFSSRKTLENLGAFKYTFTEEEDPDCIELGPHEFENGAVFIGQWKIGLRHGRGK